MLIKLVFISLIILAVFAVNTDKLRRVVIYLCLFSLASSFLYILYSAPDVAIAEAVVGSTISTILYLVALKKYKVFTIYYLVDLGVELTDKNINKIKSAVLNDIESYCFSQELEPQVIYTKESEDHILSFHQYDLLVSRVDDNFILYGNTKNYKFDELYKEIKEKSKYNIHLIQKEN